MRHRDASPVTTSAAPWDVGAVPHPAPVFAPIRDLKARTRHRDVIAALCFAFAVMAAQLLWGMDGQRRLIVVFVIMIPAALGIAFARTAPGTAITLVWGSSLLQVATLTDLGLIQIAGPYVAYVTARYGGKTAVIAGGISIGLGALLGTAYLGILMDGYRLSFDSLSQLPRSMFFLAVLATPLVTPWAVGLILRFADQKDTAEQGRQEAWHDANQARELARLRAENAGLARDVHDIVGHSLAVIIAQADSVQFTADADADRIREATANIASTARRSLMSIQSVLSRTNDATGDLPAHEVRVAELIDSIADVGRRIERDDRGAARHVPPSVAKVAYGVMREMLTNALRHATPESAIRLSRAWTYRTYTVTVENEFAPDVDTREGGRGLPGMRERLATVGGTLHVEVSPADEQPPRFTISAVLPLESDGHNRWET